MLLLNEMKPAPAIDCSVSLTACVTDPSGWNRSHTHSMSYVIRTVSRTAPGGSLALSWEPHVRCSSHSEMTARHVEDL